MNFPNRCIASLLALLAPAAAADSMLGPGGVPGSELNPPGFDPTLAPDPRGKATMLPQLSRTPAGFTESWVPGRPPIQSAAGEWNVRWSGEVGALASAGEHRSALFDQYGDRAGGLWLHALGFAAEHGARHIELAAGEVSRSDQYYRAGFGELGRYRIETSFDALPHRFANGVRSVFDGAGSGTLTLLPGLAPGAGSPSQIAAALQNARPIDLGVERKRFALKTEFTPSAGLAYYAHYSQDRRNGTRPFGGSLNFPDLGLPDMVETIEPIHTTTHQVQAGVRWAGTQLQANLGYSGSFFRNGLNALTWQSPFNSFAAPVPQARFALAPDNNSHNLKFDLGGSVGRASFNGTLSWTRMTQDDALLPPTIRSGVAPDGTNFDLWNTSAALSRPSAQARIDTLLAEAGVALAATRSTVRVKLRHYEENNKTDYTAFNPLTGQYGYIGDDGGLAFRPLGNSSPSLNPVFVPFGVFSPIHYRSIPFGYRRDNLAAEFDYRLRSKTELGLAYERENTHRRFRERELTSEDRVRLTLSNRSLAWAPLRASYQYADRGGGAYNSDPYQPFYIGQGQTAQSAPYTLADMRKFDLADRIQHKLDLRANFLVRQDMDLAASVKAVDNRYGADYGRTRERTAGFNLDWSWNYGPAASAHAGYGYQRTESTMASINDNDTGASGPASAGGSVFPLANAWNADSRDGTHQFGIGGRYAARRWTIESDYTFARSDTRIGYGYAGIGALTGSDAKLAGDAMPDIAYREHRLVTSLKYRINDKTSLRLYHRYENLSVADWHYDQLPQVTPSEVFLGAGPRGYHAHTIGIVLQFTAGK